MQQVPALQVFPEPQLLEQAPPHPSSAPPHLLVQLGVHEAHAPLLQPYEHVSEGGLGLAQALPLPGQVLANWCVELVQVAAKH